MGWDEADQQIAISDGGSGMEQFLRRNFPRAEVIIDLWHVKEYLLELGQALYAEDEDQRGAWMDRHCHMLKHQGGAAVLEQLQAIDPGASPATRELHWVTVQYFRNHQHKMDYPRYVARGWQIGSGPIESARAHRRRRPPRRRRHADHPSGGARETTAPTPSAISAPSSSANPTSGTTSGASTGTNGKATYKCDAHTCQPVPHRQQAESRSHKLRRPDWRRPPWYIERLSADSIQEEDI